ncbi:hypothetical protein BC936DRAFT_145535 [Jimgerdemannia flammicorona]|uniref:Uncharacterized protein n=2 Tax=Jimgerdemannia flammicorona TaxID=994334 RepID=A0A433QIV4_9FUNG|nr:hypothetical protein BC936DRAFT_145535 [Jimgerdemannia flammicorona]RUS29732.1 hypothetical protein BC938DRAFT_480310 [Jimgerdemannia flammicorona]
MKKFILSWLLWLNQVLRRLLGNSIVDFTAIILEAYILSATGKPPGTLLSCVICLASDHAAKDCKETSIKIPDDCQNQHPLGDEGIRRMVDALLLRGTPITRLHFGTGHLLGDDAAHDIARLLRSGVARRLSDLAVGRNWFTDAGMQEIIDALSHCSRLEMLTLRPGPSSSHVALALSLSRLHPALVGPVGIWSHYQDYFHSDDTLLAFERAMDHLCVLTLFDATGYPYAGPHTSVRYVYKSNPELYARIFKKVADNYRFRRVPARAVFALLSAARAFLLGSIVGGAASRVPREIWLYIVEEFVVKRATAGKVTGEQVLFPEQVRRVCAYASDRGTLARGLSLRAFLSLVFEDDVRARRHWAC